MSTGKMATMKTWPQQKTGHNGKLATRENWPQRKTGHKEKLATTENWPHQKTGYNGKLATTENWPQQKTDVKKKPASPALYKWLAMNDSLLTSHITAHILYLVKSLIISSLNIQLATLATFSSLVFIILLTSSRTICW